ncbi:hypothetical protein A7982_12372 [Minicystis rosea]|nr:hypothetical protein A7982_12372 [Minicystis rosea]
MRDHLLRLAAPFVLLGVIAGCKLGGETTPGHGGTGGTGSGPGAGTGTGGDNGSSSSSGSNSSSSGTGGSPGAPGWTAFPLIDDATDPNDVVFRTGNDLVTGIYFASADDGWITTTGADQTFSNGGAIFKAKQKEVTKVLFGGNRDGLCLLGTINFRGVEKSADGLIARAYACDVIASHDGGKTFGIERSTAGDHFGIEDVMAVRSRPDGSTLLVADSRYVAVTSGAPGPNAVWNDIWAPAASPPIPDPVPADQCQDGPDSQNVPTQPTAAYVSPDGNFIAYVASPNFDPQICVSTDGGHSFFPKVLPDMPEDAQPFKPAGVTFANATTGITWWANNIYPGLAYIYRTVDAGKTWKRVDVPSDVANQAIELSSAFFAPDGVHGWIVGYNYDASTALMLRTEDGGATWKSSSGDLAQKVSAAGGGKLRTGFALDASHIWVGGERGVVLANAAGGI